MIERDSFNLQVNMAIQNSADVGEVPSLTIPNLLVSNSLDHNDQNHISPKLPVLSTLQEEPTSDIDFRDQLPGGTLIPSVSLATLLSRRSYLEEDPKSLAFSDPQVNPLECFRAHVSNSSYASPVNGGCEEILYNLTNRWGSTKFPSTPLFETENQIQTEFQSHPNVWISSNSMNLTTDHPNGSNLLWNELSLSLATSQSPVRGTSIQDPCSEISFSGVTPNCLDGTMLGSNQNSGNCEELSLSFGTRRRVQFPPVILGSRYLSVVQEILSQIASFSLESQDQMSYSAAVVGAASFSSTCIAEKGRSELDSDLICRSEAQMEADLQRRAIVVKKTKLITLLQSVDERYNQCLDEIHTVVSAFHAATELDPQLHTHFALQTISFVYKNLRERISNQILAMGGLSSTSSTRDKERSFETSFIQKQWALQQLKRKDHQMWRPQRGLPERSVSVLRAWMFQNFLHPYPKDTEKQLLAVKSGLTRSQVSNWFINARVRIWKPMIEEMYAEMNRRKSSGRSEEEIKSNHRTQISINSKRFCVDKS